MKDFFQMWMQHQADPAKSYPELSLIKDDNNDGIIEINRPEEIDALLTSVKNYLGNTGFPLDGKRLVWVQTAGLTIHQRKAVNCRVKSMKQRPMHLYINFLMT